MNSVARLGLGSAQFGQDYGISNRDGRPTEAEVASILARAVEAGFGYLDTAAGYADAETLIGRHLPGDHQLRIVTKLPPVAADAITADHGKMMLATLAASLEKLRASRVYGVLIHEARDLAKPGWQYLVDALREARARTWTAGIGVSVYDEGDLALAESRFTPNIVQLPFNALDRRLASSGWLTRLRAAGVEIHARSLFLQGLLLMPPTTLPSFFAPIRGTFANLHAAWAAERLTPLSGCLRSVLCHAAIDTAIVGVNRLHELSEIEAAVNELTEDGELAPVAAVDAFYLDPRRWPSSRL